MKKEVVNCLLCNATLNEQMTWEILLGREFPRVICKECEEQFEPIEQDSKKWLEGEEKILSIYKYNDKMKDYLHQYKFMHDVVLAKVFRNDIDRILAKQPETIVPIPIHPTKLKERSFAHIDEILKASCIRFEQYLEKISVETQVGKSREERINTSRLFKLREEVQVKNKRIILVDDILTTGTTLLHASRALYEAGAKSVKAITLIKG
ncbi:competence protein ComFC [Ureibacillus massiliensis 4400831 = CIP 108448 = CCUG 49529]|uniref:Competence protein ComFC n=1 Tax=Ureibacillus massiliensis 4400831 = CIP 108448 = CCUG 49529 TaxID=1211035 RepID=A0A0A3J4H3_9BACL|nr:phosphoribosyltransferase family protein [Ureibacillus massiliensis]KGR90078.1 competence protein ComFC [Ureibacillus massiliensis 4400831 = CIP 108448 = CCUG 49529]